MGAAALTSAVAGLKKAWDAKENFATAERWTKDAERRLEQASRALEIRRKAVSEQLAELGTLRLRIQSKSLSKLVHLMNQVNGAEIGSITVEGYELSIDTVQVEDVSASAYEATDFLQHGMQGASAGAMVGVGIGQAVSMLGATSAGTAISGLSGAAATNATLAWLGGGSLASGGLGMAGGTAVLGGAIAGPMLLVMGYLAAGKSEQALTQACAHSAKLEVAAEQLENAGIALDAISLRTQEVAWVLSELDLRFKRCADRFGRMLARIRRERSEKYINAGKTIPDSLAKRKLKYDSLSGKEQNEYHMLIVLGSALFNMAKVKILNTKGGLTRESGKSVKQMSELLEVT
ncbi:hypothetical protein [Azohydromonas aeria]|uniref:hypothetical protein n=1 Tax=Azohydromonas aeria TaxID=2590212 RepID=UPI0012F9A02D|nr:hypothetical protein [Azohydromonas aeria]